MRHNEWLAGICFLSAVLGTNLEGNALEEALHLRAELANMAWLVEGERDTLI